MTVRIENLEEEIRKLNVAIEGLKAQSEETTDQELKKCNDAKISINKKLLVAKTELLTTLIESQQGQSRHMFPLFVPNLLDVFFYPISFDISSSPIHVLMDGL